MFQTTHFKHNTQNDFVSISVAIGSIKKRRLRVFLGIFPFHFSRNRRKITNDKEEKKSRKGLHFRFASKVDFSPQKIAHNT